MFGWLRGRRAKSGGQSIGERAVKQIAAAWMVDDNRTEWVENGFDWWPGSFRVEVRYHHDYPGPEEHAAALADRWRVSVATDYIDNAPVDDPKFVRLVAAMGLLSSSYSYVYLPRESAEELKAGAPTKLYLFSSAYIGPALVDWLPQFLATMAIMQPIDAEIRATAHAGLVGATPDHGPRGNVKQCDALLELAEKAYVPAGQLPSAWSDTDEFEDIADDLTGDDVLAVGKRDQLALGMPFGGDAALVMLRSSGRHPQLGNGLLVTVQIPFQAPEDEIARRVGFLNCEEAVNWTDFPQFGCWHSRDVGDGKLELAHTTFVPNALARLGLASNFAVWSIARARWTRTVFDQIEGRDRR